jgi:hypothetical protein
MLSPVTVQTKTATFLFQMQKKRGHFSVMCIAQNIISLYAPSEIASQFPPPLRSNNFTIKIQCQTSKKKNPKIFGVGCHPHTTPLWPCILVQKSKLILDLGRF